MRKLAARLYSGGAALGVPENALCVIEGTPENYMKIGMPPEVPYTNTRTHVVIKF